MTLKTQVHATPYPCHILTIVELLCLDNIRLTVLISTDLQRNGGVDYIMYLETKLLVKDHVPKGRQVLLIEILGSWTMSDQRQKIIDSVFSKRNATGGLEESYVAHIKIWEDAGPEGGGRKPRYILLSRSYFQHIPMTDSNASLAPNRG